LRAIPCTVPCQGFHFPTIRASHHPFELACTISLSDFCEEQLGQLWSMETRTSKKSSTVAFRSQERLGLRLDGRPTRESAIIWCLDDCDDVVLPQCPEYVLHVTWRKSAERNVARREGRSERPQPIELCRRCKCRRLESARSCCRTGLVVGALPLPRAAKVSRQRLVHS
jgi:hypothetical protein